MALEEVKSRTIDILIVEDDEDWIKKIKSGLKKRLENVTYDIARTGEDVFTKLKSRKLWDLIVLDFHLPDKNGTEVLSELKQNGIKKKAVGLTREAGVLEEMETACAMKAFAKSDFRKFLEYVYAYASRLSQGSTNV